jgi:hypothetical protein
LAYFGYFFQTFVEISFNYLVTLIGKPSIHRMVRLKEWANVSSCNNLEQL